MWANSHTIYRPLTDKRHLWAIRELYRLKRKTILNLLFEKGAPGSKICVYIGEYIIIEYITKFVNKYKNK